MPAENVKVAVRVRPFISFSIFGFIWGHGESIWKILRFIGLILLVSALFSWTQSDEQVPLFEHVKSTCIKFILPSYETEVSYSLLHVSALTLVKFIVLAMLTSTLIERLSRR